MKGSSPPGKAAHERTLEEFVGKDISVRDEYARWNEEAFILHGPHRLGPLKTVVSNFFQTEPRDVYWGSISGIKKIRESFSIAVPKSRPKHAILMADTYDVETGELLMTDNPVGEFYRDGLGINILGILEAYRGKGVAPYFVAAAIEATGNVEPSGAYSPLGLRTRVRAHRILVERALERGDHVPKKVREEYPDLA